MSAVTTPYELSAERIFSFGGGKQSMAVLVLGARGLLQYDAYLFSNVGEDSEHPDTLRYFREVAQPFAARYGLNLLEVRRERRDKRPETVYSRLMGPTKSIGIPVRMSNGAPGNRQCTVDFKIKVVAKWTKQHGATREHPCTVGIGFSVDESHRMTDRITEGHEVPEYPLVDRKITRSMCIDIVREAGLPPTPKSACYFCPFTKLVAWQRMAEQNPALFAKAVRVEERANEKRAALGKDKVSLSRRGSPLSAAVNTNQGVLLTEADEDAEPEEGHCMGVCAT